MSKKLTHDDFDKEVLPRLEGQGQDKRSVLDKVLNKIGAPMPTQAEGKE